MAAIETGTTCIYGVAGTVTNLFVQSYSLSASFNAVAPGVATHSGSTDVQGQGHERTRVQSAD